jgi:hypothetical protein
MSKTHAKAPVLLSGGNPQIAKADGDAPVQAFIAAMPEWKRNVGRRLDALIVRTVPKARKAVKWNSPFYGIEGQGWFLSFHVFTRYVKVTFFRGAALRPQPPGPSKDPNTRYLDIFEDRFDERQFVAWVKQAATLPGWITNAADAKPKPATRTGDWREATLARMRTLILEADPEMVEERKWKKPSNGMKGIPVWSHDGIICTGETYKNVVKLTFADGASLPDPAGLFNASLEGGTRRAIDIHEGDVVNARAFKALVRAAVARGSGSSRRDAPATPPSARKSSRRRTPAAPGRPRRSAP